MKSVIICTSPRSGSYFLADLLSKTGRVPFAEEWLTPFHRSGRKRLYDLREEISICDLLASLMENETNNEGVFSIKVMWPTMEETLWDICQEKKVSMHDAWGYLQKYFQNPRIIFLHREDLDAQAISLLKARETGIWRSEKSNDADYNVEKLVYSHEEIHRNAYNLSEMNRKWEDFFREHKLPYVKLSYEQLKEEKSRFVSSICNYIGLGDVPVEEDVQLRFRPLNDRINQEWCEQYLRDKEIFNMRLKAPDVALNASGLSAEFEKGTYEIVCGEADVLTVQICNGGALIIPRFGYSDDKLRVVGRVDLIAEDGESLQEGYWFSELPCDLIAGEAVAIRIWIGRLQKAGRYVLRFQLYEAASEDEILSECTARLQVVHPVARRNARKYWPETWDLTNGWQYLPWLGYFLDDKFPWIYHQQHEWWFVDDQYREGGVCRILDSQFEWILVDPDQYPIVKCESDERCLKFIKRNGKERLFEDLSNGDILNVSSNTPEQLKKITLKSEATRSET